MNKLFSLMSCMFLFSCGSGSDTSDNITLVDWLSEGISTYTFHYEETGFSPLSGIVWEIHVAEDEVFDVVYVGGEEPNFVLSTSTAPTVSDLFDQISNCKGSNTCIVTEEEYDLEYMYPVIYRSSYGEDGSGFNASNFLPL